MLDHMFLKYDLRCLKLEVYEWNMDLELKVQRLFFYPWHIMSKNFKNQDLFFSIYNLLLVHLL
jgi:hypothetical protein